MGWGEGEEMMVTIMMRNLIVIQLIKNKEM